VQFVKQNLRCLRKGRQGRNLNKNKEQLKVRKRNEKEGKKWDFDDDAVGARF